MLERCDALRAVLIAALTLANALSAEAASSCSVQSPASVVPVVELYTSEGCSSCPPADRWLSHLKLEPDTVALAFHVDYWDSLGWKDRFASPAYTQRQAEQQRRDGARFSYTPQVLLDGSDRTDWPGLSALDTGRAMAKVAVALSRDGESFTATISPVAGAPARLAAYWAVTEDGHVTTVKAGENGGATLHHDHVVRDYKPVAAWTAKVGMPTELHFAPAASADPAHPRAVNLVVVDADSGKPLQATRLGC